MISFCLLLLFRFSFSLYLPGVAPRDYVDGEDIALKVNKLDSAKTQLPYDFYSLPFCRPNQIIEAAENLGEILSGDRIESSEYKLSMLMPESCKILCRKVYNKGELDHFAEKIGEEYRVNWIVDNIPAATKYYAEQETKEGTKEYFPYYEKGFALGFIGSKEISPDLIVGAKYVNNHVRLIIFYHQEVIPEPVTKEKSGDAAPTEPSPTKPVTPPTHRIVGFEVEPFSIKHEVNGAWENGGVNSLKTCDPTAEPSINTILNLPPQAVSGEEIDKKGEEEVIWTYDVLWTESDIKWASRWDLYLKMTDSQIHWFSIINSITIVLFLSGMVAMIMARTLHKDLVKYNEVDLSEEARQEETGWKVIHGDVFRAPRFGSLFAALVGTGCQVFAMLLLTLIFAVFGFLSPANRGALLTALLLLYVFMGIFAGYNATTTFQMFKLEDWKRNTLFTSLLFPGITFSLFFLLNLLVWGQKSSGAVHFTTLAALLALWLGISVPLVYTGSYFALRRPPFQPPVKVADNAHVSNVKETWYTQPSTSILIGGALPFGACFIEIFFIMSSVWLHQFYYVFGFLFIVFIILVITCAEISIVMCYFQLCNEDPHWWWRSYFTSGSSALYLFLYSIFYFFTRLQIIKFVSGVLFFGYMLLVSLFFFVLTGTIGYVACFHFVKKIYSSIKIE